MYILYSVTSEVDSYGHRANHRDLILHIYLKENKKKHTRAQTHKRSLHSRMTYIAFFGRSCNLLRACFLPPMPRSLLSLAPPSCVAAVLSSLLFHLAPCWHRGEDERLLGGLFVALVAVCRHSDAASAWFVLFVYFSIRTYLDIDLCVLTRIWSYFLECSSF